MHNEKESGFPQKTASAQDRIAEKKALVESAAAQLGVQIPEIEEPSDDFMQKNVEAVLLGREIDTEGMRAARQAVIENFRKVIAQSANRAGYESSDLTAYGYSVKPGDPSHQQDVESRKALNRAITEAENSLRRSLMPRREGDAHEFNLTSSDDEAFGRAKEVAILDVFGVDERELVDKAPDTVNTLSDGSIISTTRIESPTGVDVVRETHIDPNGEPAYWALRIEPRAWDKEPVAV